MFTWVWMIALILAALVYFVEVIISIRMSIKFHLNFENIPVTFKIANSKILVMVLTIPCPLLLKCYY